MNEKGFTLIEMITVVSILTILGVIVIPMVGGILKDKKREIYDVQINNIKEATSNYVSENFMSIDIPNNSSVGIHLSFLKNNGYIDNNITNPMTYEEFSDSMVILISNNSNVYSYIVCDSYTVCDTTGVTFIDG